MTCYEKNVNESSTIMRQDWFLFIADFGSVDITWLKSEGGVLPLSSSPLLK